MHSPQRPFFWVLVEDPQPFLCTSGSCGYTIMTFLPFFCTWLCKVSGCRFIEISPQIAQESMLAEWENQWDLSEPNHPQKYGFPSHLLVKTTVSTFYESSRKLQPGEFSSKQCPFWLSILAYSPMIPPVWSAEVHPRGEEYYLGRILFGISFAIIGCKNVLFQSWT